MKNEVLYGVRCALPITMGYIPIGLAFGVLAVQQGLALPEIAMMSLIVYAGSAQFIASAMIAAGAGAFSIVATTFLVNLRHLLMSASLSPYLKTVTPLYQAVIGLGVTDETFAVSITQAGLGKASKLFFIGLHGTAHLSWLASTILGGIVGSAVPDPARWGLDFALSAMFIGLLILQLKNKTELLVALAAGLLSLSIAMNIKGNFHIIIASMMGAALGVYVELWKAKSSLSCSE